MLQGNGQLEVAVSGENPIQITLADGDYLNVARGDIHSFRNLYKTEAKFIATLYPAGAERVFLKFTELYSQLKNGDISKDEYLEGMKNARKNSCYIIGVKGGWK